MHWVTVITPVYVALSKDDKFRKSETDASQVLRTLQSYTFADHKLFSFVQDKSLSFNTVIHCPGLASQCGYQVPRCCIRSLDLTFGCLWPLSWSQR